MRRVFVVLENVPFEGGAVIGVFSTRERANRYCGLNPIDEDDGDALHWLVEEYIVDALCGESDDAREDAEM